MLSGHTNLPRRHGYVVPSYRVRSGLGAEQDPERQILDLMLQEPQLGEAFRRAGPHTEVLGWQCLQEGQERVNGGPNPRHLHLSLPSIEDVDVLLVDPTCPHDEVKRAGAGHHAPSREAVVPHGTISRRSS